MALQAKSLWRSFRAPLRNEGHPPDCTTEGFGRKAMAFDTGRLQTQEWMSDLLDKTQGRVSCLVSLDDVHENARTHAHTHARIWSSSACH